VHDLVEDWPAALGQHHGWDSTEQRAVSREEPALEPVRIMREDGIHREGHFFEEGRQEQCRVGVAQESNDGSRPGLPRRLSNPSAFPGCSARGQPQQRHYQSGVPQDDRGPLWHRRRADDRERRDKGGIDRRGPVNRVPAGKSFRDQAD
jgi:hypothetical protein